MKKVIIALLAAGLLTACGGETNTKEIKEDVKQEEPAKEEIQEEKTGEMTLEEKKKATDLPLEIYNLVNGSNTEILGQMSQLKMPKSEVTDEFIKEWYNKVKPLNNNYDLIIYEDTIDGDNATGVSIEGENLIYKNIGLVKDDEGIYMTGSLENIEELKLDN
mgnify:CR=1 FL=1|nr:MAG TPA_asm: Prokaryotic membrane lipoprotein lipid attachment site [Caudoviricetes sp.]